MTNARHLTNDYYYDPLPDLARANGFTRNDLEENRRGKISDRQWIRLVLRSLKPASYTGGTLAAWLCCCYAVQTMVPSIVLWITGMKGYGLALVGGITLASVVAFLVSIIKSGRTVGLVIADLSVGKAAFSEGRVLTSRGDGQGLSLARLCGEQNYWYVLNNQYFEVDMEAHAALPDRMLFRLYHTPRSKMLLSIEPKPATRAMAS
jgi:hypothetical protein